ncbi:MAG: hypothetical protein JSU79_06165 [Dehalococcoidales bacterium]|nr:MAG: hypothetical protein JSU79_06165 [Dehalococcoidales bacterium]
MMKVDRENINATDSFFPHKRENVLARIMENLVQSGILLPGETSEYRDYFSCYDWNELLQILNESNRQRAACDPVIVHTYNYL